MFCRIYRNRLQSIKLIHPRLHSKSCAKRQIFLRNHRRIRDNRNLASHRSQNSRRRPTLILQLKLRGMSQRRSHSHRHVLTRQLICDHMSLCHMLQRNIQPKLFCNTQGCKYIISLMCMCLQRYLFLQYRDQGLQLQIKLRLLLHIIPCRLFLLHISLCLKQLIPEKCRSCHPGGIPLILVTVLGVLPERTLHCHRIFHYHFINPFTRSLHCRKGSPQYIRTARTGSYASYSCFSCMLEAWVKGIDSVDRAKLRRHQIVEFTVIPSLITDSVTVQTGVAVCLHKPRIHLQALRVDHFCPLRNFQIRTDSANFSILDQDISFDGFLLCHCVNQTIFNA